MKRALLNFCSYIIMLVLLLWIFSSSDVAGKLRMFKDLNFVDAAELLLLSLVAYAGNGLEYYLIGSRLGFKMDRRDILLLPMAMNLSGTLLPFQGAMAYQVFFFKKKYGVALSHGFAVAGFLYLLTMTIGGIAGLCVGILGRNTSWLFLLISAVLAVAAPLAIAMLACCRRIYTGIAAVDRVCGFVRAVLEGIAEIMKDFRLVVLMTAIYLVRLLSMIAMFSLIARRLEYEVGFLALLLLNLWNLLSLILKITPNNLGVSQLVSGVMFTLIGLPKEQGEMISLAATLFFILMALSFGMLAMAFQLWEISHRPTNSPETPAGEAPADGLRGKQNRKIPCQPENGNLFSGEKEALLNKKPSKYCKPGKNQ